MNFFATASLSRPSRGFIPLVLFLRVRSHFVSPCNRPSSFDVSTILSASCSVSSCPFSFKRELDSVLFFLYFSLIPSTQVSRISTCGVVRNHQDCHGDRPGGHGSSLSSDSDLRQLEHSRSITLFVLLEPSFRPFHFASTSETSEVGDPQSNENVISKIILK